MFNGGGGTIPNGGGTILPGGTNPTPGTAPTPGTPGYPYGGGITTIFGNSPVDASPPPGGGTPTPGQPPTSGIWYGGSDAVVVSSTPLVRTPASQTSSPPGAFPLTFGPQATPPATPTPLASDPGIGPAPGLEPLSPFSSQATSARVALQMTTTQATESPGAPIADNAQSSVTPRPTQPPSPVARSSPTM